MAKFTISINGLGAAYHKEAEDHILNQLQSDENGLIPTFIELVTELRANSKPVWIAYFIAKFPKQALEIIDVLNQNNLDLNISTITRDTAKWLLANNADTDFVILNNFFTKIHVANTDNIAKLLQAAWTEAEKAAKRTENPDNKKGFEKLQTSLPTIFSKLDEEIQKTVLASVLANVNDNTYSKEFRTAIVLAAIQDKANIARVSNAITALHTADTTAPQNQPTKTPERLYFIWDIIKKDSNTLTALFAELSPAEKQAVLASVLADVNDNTTYSKEFRTAVVAAALQDTNGVEQVSNAIQSLHDNAQPIKTATRFNFAWKVSASLESAAAASTSTTSPAAVTPNKFAAKLHDIFLGLDLTAKEKILGNVVNYPNSYDADFRDSIVTIAINDSHYISTFAEQFDSDPKIKILHAAPPAFQAKILDKTPGRFKSILIDPKPIYETSAGQEFFENLTPEHQCNLLRYLNTNNKSDIKDTLFKSVGKGTQTEIINTFLANDDDQKLAFNLFDSLEPSATGEKLAAAFSDPQINILNSTKLLDNQAAKLVCRVLNDGHKSDVDLYEFLTKFHAPKRKLMFDALLAMQNAQEKNEGHQVINHLLQNDSNDSKKMAKTLFHQTGFDKVEYEKWGKQVVSRVTHPTGYLRRQSRKWQQEREEIANGHKDGTLKDHIISSGKKQARILASFARDDASYKTALNFFNKIPSNSIRRAVILNELYKTNQASKATYLFNEGASTAWFEDHLDAKAKILGSNVVDPETKSELLNNINSQLEPTASFQRTQILLSKEISADGRIELFQGLTPEQQRDTLKEMQRTRHYFSSMNKNYYAREWFNKIVETDVPDLDNLGSTVKQSAAKTRAYILTSSDTDTDPALYTTRFGRRLFSKLSAIDKAETLVEMANSGHDNAATTLFSYSSFFSSHKSVKSISAKKNDRLDIIKHLLNSNNDAARLGLAAKLLVSLLSAQKQNQLLAHLDTTQRNKLFNELKPKQQQAILNVKSAGKKIFTADYLSLARKIELLKSVTNDRALTILQGMDVNRIAELIVRPVFDSALKDKFFDNDDNDTKRFEVFKKLNTSDKAKVLSKFSTDNTKTVLFNHNLFKQNLKDSLPLVGNGKTLFRNWVQGHNNGHQPSAAEIHNVLTSLPNDNKREKYFNCLNETKKSEVITAATEDNAQAKYPFYKSPATTTPTHTR